MVGTSPAPTLAFEAGAEATEIARTYTETATAFAMIGDRRGLAYALRCAAAAIVTASEAVQTLRPALQDGGGR